MKGLFVKMKKQFQVLKILAIVLPMLLFIGLAIIINTTKFSMFEQWVYAESIEDMSDVMTLFMKFITYLGNASSIIIICLILFCLPKTRKFYAVFVSLSAVLATILNVLLKNVFARERPNILRIITETDYSFPSGHAMISMACFSMIGLLYLKYGKNTALRVVFPCACILLSLLIGFSRIYLGVHYAGDVIGRLAHRLFSFCIAVCRYA